MNPNKARSQFLRIFILLIGVGAALVVGIISPLLIGGYLGHEWGVLSSILVLIGWCIMGIAKAKASSTRIFWFGGLIIIVIIGVNECLRL